MPRNKAGQEAKASVRAWGAETQEVARIAHRAMLAEGVGKAGEEVKVRATAEAWVVETEDVVKVVHRVMLVGAEGKVWEEAEVTATAEVWVVKKARVAVKAKPLTEGRVVVGIAEAEQAVPVLLVRQVKTVTEGEAGITPEARSDHMHWCLTGYCSTIAA